jgi:ferritin
MTQPKKLPAAIVSILNERLKDEFSAFYFYRSVSNWCKNVGYMYASKYFAQESDEELNHAKMIEAYLTDWNVMPAMDTIKSSDEKFTSLSTTIEMAYEIEYELYESYEESAQKILKADICTFKLVQTLLEIQQKSVAVYSDMLNELALINPSDKFQLYYIEKRLFKNA